MEHEQGLVGELRLELMRRHRPPEQIALHLVATMLAQKLQLFVGFHALGDDCQVEAVGHGDDRTGNLRVLFAFGQTVDEGTVDLQDVDGNCLR